MREAAYTQGIPVGRKKTNELFGDAPDHDNKTVDSCAEGGRT
jgi:hypothetical protein